MMDWFVYAMVADAGDARRYFKIGITSKFEKRVAAVQTGCPLPLVHGLRVKVPSQITARRIEGHLHGRLAPFHTSGEWFLFDLGDPEHKRAFNSASREAMAEAGVKWELFNLSQIRTMAAEDALIRRRAKDHAGKLAIARMAVSGYRHMG